MSYQIDGDDELIRRVPLDPSYIEVDAQGNYARDATGRPQLSSAAFRFDPNGLSIDILQIWLQAGTEEQALDAVVFNRKTAKGTGYLAAILFAKIPMSYGLECEHDPTPATLDSPANPAHALIKGRINKTMARSLAAACRLVEKTASGNLHRSEAL